MGSGCIHDATPELSSVPPANYLILPGPDRDISKFSPTKNFFPLPF
jgi:hypothetical protein